MSTVEKRVKDFQPIPAKTREQADAIQRANEKLLEKS